MNKSKVKQNNTAGGVHGVFNYITQTIFGAQSRSASRKFINSIIAIVVGIILVIIFFLINGYKPGEVFSLIFVNAFDTLKERTMMLFPIYIFAGLAVAVGFKAGLFNIGVPGQMTIGGGVALFVIFSMGPDAGAAQYIGGLILAIIAGAGLSAFAAFLKTQFKVHEVVSTIMLNWIVFYVFQYLFKTSSWYNLTGGSESTISVSAATTSSDGVINAAWQFTNSNTMINIMIASGVIVALLLFFAVSFTTFGYKVKMVGLNRSAAKYAGVNENLLTIGIFSLSGALAAIAGYFYFVMFTGTMSFSAAQPVVTGFNSIAVSLIAYNNPAGLVLSAILYAVFEVGVSNVVITGISVPFPTEYYNVFVGLLMYFIAISTVFGNITPYHWIHRLYVKLRYTNYLSKSDRKEYSAFISKYYNQKLIDSKDEPLIKFLSKNETMSYSVKRKILLKYYKEHYSKLIKNEKLVLKENQDKIKILKKSLIDLHDQLSSKSIDNNKKLELIEQLGVKRRDVNVELAKLHYNFDKNYKAELKSKLHQLKLAKKEFIKAALEQHNSVWGAALRSIYFNVLTEHGEKSHEKHRGMKPMQVMKSVKKSMLLFKSHHKGAL